ncbi:hypothetical protein [Bradyrhizobium elkanii]|uniref:hypothetical protein n=1 Tax=Bradyrhizobium elkanii TaxID=29448 RepID=UPI0008413995|nr:hypothetical protein [Bradyrhizobium elkanii]ODM80901.1 hypothetical protein A6X20_21110 [Bradyrhizobium elkanii]ODM85282.1 hypothetical protein A6452_11640 [Bradyrhizobium elkanii]
MIGRDLRDRRLMIAVVGPAGMLVAGAFAEHRSTAAAYLVAWIAVSAVPIGTLGVLMTSYLVRRAWTEELQPAMTAICATLPIFGVLFLPVLLDLAALYPAAGPHAALPAFKAVYLAPWFVAARTVIYFIVWTCLALKLQAAWPDPDRMARTASGGLIVYAISVSFAGVDWIEALQPQFHSSIYGLLYLGMVLLDGVAGAIGLGLLLCRIRRAGGYSALLLSTILLWAYLHAMQYIVIWSANIPDEVTWYIDRSSEGWQFVLSLLAVGQLVFPFFALVSRRVRADRRWLLGLCALTLAMRICEASVLAFPAIDGLPGWLTGIMLVAGLALLMGLLAWGVAFRLRHGRWLNFAPPRVRAEAERR